MTGGLRFVKYDRHFPTQILVECGDDAFGLPPSVFDVPWASPNPRFPAEFWAEGRSMLSAILYSGPVRDRPILPVADIWCRNAISGIVLDGRASPIAG